MFQMGIFKKKITPTVSLTIPVDSEILRTSGL